MDGLYISCVDGYINVGDDHISLVDGYINIGERYISVRQQSYQRKNLLYQCQSELYQR